VSSRFTSVALMLWLPIAAVVLWWTLSADSVSPFWPPLSDILETFKDDWLFEKVKSDLLPSVWRTAAGLGIAIVAGLVVGVALGLSSSLRRALEPVTDFFRALPMPAMLPLAIVIFGVSPAMEVFFIAFGSVWPILMNTMDGVRGIDLQTLEVARVYRLRRRDVLRQVVLPAAMPQFFAGLRIALAVALVLMVISEMVASTSGLGNFVLVSQQSFQILSMWSGMLMLGVLGFAANVLLVLVERRALAWHRGWRASLLGGA
jgi:sulfonate transport system permease protein